MREPAWVMTLLTEVAACIQPEIERIGLGHFYGPRPRRGKPYGVCIFPTRVEIVQRGPDDGRRFRVDIRVCLSAVSDLFDKEPHIDWTVPVRYDGCLDGPRVTMAGSYRRHLVDLVLFDRAPRRYPAVTVFDPDSGHCRLREETEPVPGTC